MKILLLILLSAAVCIAANYKRTGAARWDKVSLTFKKWTAIPSTQAEAVKEGWSLLQDDCLPEQDKDKSPFVGRRYVGQDRDETVILIFGANGHLAGIQFSYVQKTTDDGNARILYKERTYVTAYFTSTSNVCNPKAPADSDKIGEKLIFLAGTGKEMEIPRQAIASESGWEEGKCIPGMGYHWWYNFKKETQCEKLFPFFLLYDKTGNLNAFGFNYFHEFESSWVENPDTSFMKYFMKTVPTCLTNANKLLTTMHVYLSTDWWRRYC